MISTLQKLWNATTVPAVSSTLRSSGDVTPNRRGARSREAVLDAAERLIAEHGYEAATVSALVEQAGVPASSVYHYFGSKEGVLLAVMERGAKRYLAEVPAFGRRIGSAGTFGVRSSAASVSRARS